MEVMLAGSGNYVKELAKAVTFCSFVEIKRIGCTLRKLATASSSHQSSCVCVRAVEGGGGDEHILPTTLQKYSIPTIFLLDK